MSDLFLFEGLILLEEGFHHILLTLNCVPVSPMHNISIDSLARCLTVEGSVPILLKTVSALEVALFQLLP